MNTVVEKRIILIDQQPLIREGLTLVLETEANLTVCGQAGDGLEAAALFEALEPDMVITDAELPGMNGLELARQLLARKPDLCVLVLSRHDDAICAERALRAGAHGYVLKEEAKETVVQAVQQVLQGGYYVSKQVNDALLAALANAPQPLIPSPASVLSARELEFFQLTAKGLDLQEIADHMHVSAKTVAVYRVRTKQKLNISSTTDLIRLAVKVSDPERVCYCWKETTDR